MSQRLLIAPKQQNPDGTAYDSICWPNMSDGSIFLTLCEDWLLARGGAYLGPWKVRIEDVSLLARMTPILKAVFFCRGHDYPDCIWAFYWGDKSIEHPTSAELAAWLLEAA